MGQILIRSLDDAVIESYRSRAKVAGMSLEQYMRDFLSRHATMDRDERLAFTQGIRDRVGRTTRPMTRKEIRDGLE